MFANKFAFSQSETAIRKSALFHSLPFARTLPLCARAYEMVTYIPINTNVFVQNYTCNEYCM